jgi:2-polyprenyl-3-methyl-5-hydroxy-6-metoxy-1,4-benzoquinol methylase
MFFKNEDPGSEKNQGETQWWVGYLDTFSNNPILARELFFKKMVEENHQRLQNIQSGFASKGVTFRPRTVLDVGNGPCGLLHAFESNIEKIGCDPNNSNYIKAKILYNPDAQIKFLSDIAEIKQKNYFDFVSCINVLDHVIHPKKMVRQIWRVMKPGATLWLSVDTRLKEETHTVHPHALNEKIMTKYLKRFITINFEDDKRCYDEHPTNRRLDYWLIKK